VAVHVRQPALDAVVVDRELRVVDAEQAQRRRVEVVALGRILRRLEAELVARAVGRASLDATAGHPHGERARVMVAALALRGRLATELRLAHHERRVEEAVGLQV